MSRAGAAQTQETVLIDRHNISALAKEYGVSRTTVRRRLAAGWTPSASIDGETVEDNQVSTLDTTSPSTPPSTPGHSFRPDEIAEQNQSVSTPSTPIPSTPGRLVRPFSASSVPSILLSTADVHPWPRPASIPGRRWRAVGRAATGLAVVGCGIAIAVTSIRANAWFGRSLTTDPTAGEIFSNLSVLAEITACVIPTANRFYWHDGDRWTAFRGFVLMAVALTVVFFAASGFVLNTISTGVEVRGDRITPAVQLAERTADTLTKSRADECRRRGDRCRDLEAQERKALADLAAVRSDVRAHADPQAQAMHVDSNTARTIQAAALVAMCLCAGYLISFGAGLIWPHGRTT
jgi:hypothetical protein